MFVWISSKKVLLFLLQCTSKVDQTYGQLSTNAQFCRTLAIKVMQYCVVARLFYVFHYRYKHTYHSYKCTQYLQVVFATNVFNMTAVKLFLVITLFKNSVFTEQSVFCQRHHENTAIIKWTNLILLITLKQVK